MTHNPITGSSWWAFLHHKSWGGWLGTPHYTFPFWWKGLSQPCSTWLIPWIWPQHKVFPKYKGASMRDVGERSVWASLYQLWEICPAGSLDLGRTHYLGKSKDDGGGIAVTSRAQHFLASFLAGSQAPRILLRLQHGEQIEDAHWGDQEAAVPSFTWIQGSHLYEPGEKIPFEITTFSKRVSGQASDQKWACWVRVKEAQVLHKSSCWFFKWSQKPDFPQKLPIFYILATYSIFKIITYGPSICHFWLITLDAPNDQKP